MLLLDKRLQKAQQRLILPLDNISSYSQALELIYKFHPYVGTFKIGYELITAGLAPKLIEKIHQLGRQVFYDPKFFDIPNTVGKSSEKASSVLNVEIFNIHASNQRSAIIEAVKNKGNAELYGVSVLTSFNKNDCEETYNNAVDYKVINFALKLKECGCDGIICSPRELGLLDQYDDFSDYFKNFKKITPGVRPSFAATDDQARVMTPFEAIKNGATYLVIGRPLTNPPSTHTQAEAAEAVLKEISEAIEQIEDNFEYKEMTQLSVEELRTQHIKDIFAECSAIIIDNHFVYKSGLHGSAYVNKDAIYSDTDKVSMLCEYMAESFQYHDVDVVLGPAMGGVILAQWTAHHLSVLTGRSIQAVFADKDGDGFVIKRGQENIIKGKKILVVEDVLTTGGSVQKVVEVATLCGADIVGVVALCNRGGITANDIGVLVLRSLIDVSFETEREEDCSLCKKSLPINTSLGHGKAYLENQKH